jgi:5-methylcytosine-specific restriction endonuclease McrA
MGLADLTFLTDRPAMACPKGKTRLELTAEQRPLTKIDEQEFRNQVWARDLHHCRHCGREVKRILGRVPERGEVHHVHGRTGDLRFDVRAAVLLCMVCHERLSGKVNAHRLVIVAAKTFTIRQGTFTDATYPVTFKESL